MGLHFFLVLQGQACTSFLFYRDKLALLSCFTGISLHFFLVGLGLACQAKGHSNRIPTFKTLPRIYGNNRKKKEKRGKVQTTACKAYQCSSKKAHGNKNIFSVEHDS